MAASLLNNKQFYIVLGLIGAAGAYVYAKRKDIGEAVNPLSNQNIVYRATEATATAVSGDGNKYALQDFVFGLFNPQAVEREEELLKPDTLESLRG